MVLALGRVLHALPRALEEEMVRAAGVSPTEFTALLLLSQQPDGRLRMTDLAAASGLTPSRITRVVGALSRQGWVRKERDVDDARGSLAVLTEQGAARVRSARPVHDEGARTWALDFLPPYLLPAVGAWLEAMGRALQERDLSRRSAAPESLADALLEG